MQHNKNPVGTHQLTPTAQQADGDKSNGVPEVKEKEKPQALLPKVSPRDHAHDLESTRCKIVGLHYK
jgi:hypothetical protein